MSKPRIVQCLCGPARHCIQAIAYEPGTGVLAEANAAGSLRELIDTAISEYVMNPWCAICGSKRQQWVFEDKQLKFNSLEEARPFLRQAEEQQRRINQLFEEGKN
jgi:hypothetical protein